MTAIAIIVLLVSLIFFCLISVEAYTGVIIVNRISGAMRSTGPGWSRIWPWEKAVEGSEISLKKSNHVFESDFETQDEATISLKVSFDYMPLETNLVEFQRFGFDDRLSGIKERIRSILSIEVRKLKDRDAVMDQLKALGESAKKIFEASISESGKPIEQYYGTNLSALMISDAALPQIVKDATAKKEAQEKENEMRKMDMDNIKKMAKELVAASGGSLPFEEALRRIQIQFGKVKDENKTYGLNKGTQEIIVAALKEVFGGK
ncbi:MAG: SPFH domain-containing protein [Patescibacteria group bacterium]